MSSDKESKRGEAMSESRLEIRLIAPARQRGVAPVALVLHHAGTCHIVTQGSHAELDLVGRGAVHIGRVSFDPPRPPPSTLHRFVEVATGEASLCWGSTHN